MTPTTPTEATGLDFTTAPLTHPTPEQDYAEIVNRLNIMLSAKPWSIEEIGAGRCCRIILHHLGKGQRWEDLGEWLRPADTEILWPPERYIARRVEKDFTAAGWAVAWFEHSSFDLRFSFTPMAPV